MKLIGRFIAFSGSYNLNFDSSILIQQLKKLKDPDYQFHRMESSTASFFIILKI